MIKKSIKRSKFLLGLVAALRGFRTDIQTICLRVRRERVISEYLKNTEVKKLHLGCGTNILSGWLNADLCPSGTETIYMDATRRLSFREGRFDFVFSEHMIEHLEYKDGFEFLCECFRILKPAGIIRIATPNLENIISLLCLSVTKQSQEYLTKAAQRYFPDDPEPLPGMVVNNFLYNFGHRFVYSPADLKRTLNKVGFVEITLCLSQKSRIPDLCKLEKHANRVGTEIDSFETMVFEAKKPLDTEK